MKSAVKYQKRSLSKVEFMPKDSPHHDKQNVMSKSFALCSLRQSVSAQRGLKSGVHENQISYLAF